MHHGRYLAERVVIQAACDGLLLVTFPERDPLSGHVDERVNDRTYSTRWGPIAPWQWIPRVLVEVDAAGAGMGARDDR